MANIIMNARKKHQISFLFNQTNSCCNDDVDDCKLEWTDGKYSCMFKM